MSTQIGTLRSDFLVHWTGAKDIEKEYNDQASADYHDDDVRRMKYVTRLCTTLTGKYSGLWMRKTEEVIHGGDGSKITSNMAISVTCFSEIKLSDVRKHTERYGCLGFGFARDFVINRFGAPVQYVSGTGADIVTENLANGWHYLEEMDGFIHSGSSDCLGEWFPKLDRWVSGAKKALDVNMSFIKNMSDQEHVNFPKDFTFLDEAEWRIVKTEKARKNGLIKWFPRLNRPLMEWHGENYPDALIPFDRSDLRVLIFPDRETRKMAFKEESIRQWFGELSDFPIIATVDECSQF